MSLEHQQGASAPQTPEQLLDYIMRNIPVLRAAQHRSNSRTLRNVLNAAERLWSTQETDQIELMPASSSSE